MYRFTWLGGEGSGQEEKVDEKLILFSGNDYMGLSSHPAIRHAAVKVLLSCIHGYCLVRNFFDTLGFAPCFIEGQILDWRMIDFSLFDLWSGLNQCFGG